MGPSAHRLIVTPELAYPQLAGRLRALGLSERPSTAVTPPLVPGEPEMASWTDPDAGTRLTYTFNPVVGLRVLSPRGPGAAGLRARLAAELPVLAAPAIRELLASDEPRRVLLGLLAAGALEAYGLADAVAGLRDHPDRTIARAAGETARRLTRSLAGRGAAELARERVARPGRSVLFRRLGGAHERRQIVRWLIHDRRSAEGDTAAVLRSALEDPDWEVRATAMLAAARLGARDLLAEVRRTELPRTSRGGPPAGDRSVLKAARKAVLEHLAGEPLPPVPAGTPSPAPGVPPDTPEAMRAHLRRCVAGEGTPWRDGVFLLVEALTTPLTDPGPPSFRPPAGVEERDGEYRVAGTGIELRWVPPVPHWLGSGDPDLAAASPIRRTRPDAGFLIAAVPLDGEPRSLAAARATCEELGRRSGLRARLPTPDEWEMAVRGPDGRRHPWGNGMEGDPREHRSPWGLGGLFTAGGEWTATPEGGVRVCGADALLRPAARRSNPDPEERHGLRVVVDLPASDG